MGWGRGRGDVPPARQVRCSLSVFLALLRTSVVCKRGVQSDRVALVCLATSRESLKNNTHPPIPFEVAASRDKFALRGHCVCTCCSDPYCIPMKSITSQEHKHAQKHNSSQSSTSPGAPSPTHGQRHYSIPSRVERTAYVLLPSPNLTDQLSRSPHKTMIGPFCSRREVGMVQG